MNEEKLPCNFFIYVFHRHVHMYVHDLCKNIITRIFGLYHFCWINYVKVTQLCLTCLKSTSIAPVVTLCVSLPKAVVLGKDFFKSVQTAPFSEGRSPFTVQ